MDSAEEPGARPGGPPAFSDWIEVDQSMIDAHADTHRDWQHIHVDPARAAGTPFGGTVAHGFLTLSLLSAMARDSGIEPDGAEMGLNYGFDRVRFVAPVRAGARIRGRFAPVSARERAPGEILFAWDVRVEIEGEERPALVAEWLNLYRFDPGEG